MKNTLLLSFFSILLFSNFTENKNHEQFAFDKLKCGKIIFKDIMLANVEGQIYDDRISLIEEADSVTESKIYPVKLSGKYEIYHGCYDFIPNENQINNKEYLQFYDTKININSLLEKNISKKKYSDENYIVFTKSIDSFSFNGNDFILLSARDRRFFRNLERNYWILLQVKDRDVIKYFCFIDGYISGKDCFGDFNNDGFLDYMNWDFKKDTIPLYSLKNNNFDIDEKHFIKVQQSKEQVKMMKENGVILPYDMFDRKKSKWFYKL